ncbi:MAG: cation diffusion facilitator family transporter [Gammaproteobacteria bacterium]|nr:cation diffusion facilitator family transporter [Gammaproteobacteria bacterium]
MHSHPQGSHHDHDHHHHSVEGSHRRLLAVLVLTLGFAAVEAVAGWWTGSLALLGDAGHMVTDSLALGVAAAASLLALRGPSRRHSYGLGRVEVLAALGNALLMIGLVALISAEAVQRLGDPQPVHGAGVMVVAFVGLLVNLAAAWLLMGGRDNLNVRAALLHVMGDLLGSVAALVSGAVILATGWTTIDPLLSLLIVVLILASAVRVLLDALHALMEGVPPHLNMEEIGYAMAEEPGVVSVHDLHIWSISSTRVALSAHVVVGSLAGWRELLERLRAHLDHDFGIDHVTLQPEEDGQRIAVTAIRGLSGTSPAGDGGGPVHDW